MLALSLVLISTLTAADVAPKRQRETREMREMRAARLLTVEEQAQVADINRQIAELRRDTANLVLLGSSIALMVASVVIPVGLGVAGIVATLGMAVVGVLFALFGSTAAFSAIPEMWVGLFSWIPVVGWIVMAGCLVAGALMFLAAELGDLPRRRHAHDLRVVRNRIIDAAMARPEQTMLSVPMTTVLSF